VKLFIGIILTAFIIGFLTASILAYPTGAESAVTNPWEAIQFTVYKIAGQEEKATEIEERIENRQSSPQELEELPDEDNYPYPTNMP